MYRWDSNSLSWTVWDGSLTTGNITIGTVNQGTGGASAWLVSGPLTDAQLRATPVPVSATNLDALLSTRNAEATQLLIKAKTDNLDVALSTRALEAGGNLAAIKADVDKIPAQGQAVAANSTPVVLPATQVTTLTPPAAITGFAIESTQLTGNTSLTAIDTDIKATQPRSITSIVPGVGPTNLGKAEDAASADGDTGVGVLGVRQSIPSTTTNAVGDYAFVKTDDQGRLWINSDVLGIALNRHSNLLQQLVVEMRVSNHYLQSGLNVIDDADSLRQDIDFTLNSVN